MWTSITRNHQKAAPSHTHAHIVINHFTPYNYYTFTYRFSLGEGSGSVAAMMNWFHQPLTADEHTQQEYRQHRFLRIRIHCMYIYTPKLNVGLREMCCNI